MQAMRERALSAERQAQTAASRAARERARGRSDAASWWYARHVELLIGRADVIAALVREAEGIAATEEQRGSADRARGRREIDVWVLQGFKRRWDGAARLRSDNTEALPSADRIG